MSDGGRGGFARDALLVAAAAVALYLAAGAGGYGFVNYDDDAVVQGNPVQSWGTLGAAFTSRMAHAWLPLYALSLGLDNILFGPGNPGAYHLHSILLHSLNAVLVLALARRLGMARGAALLAGLLFAVHPAVTESVAWVASRKDLLSFAFAAGSALVFLRAEEEPRRPGLHAAGALLLALAMLAKGTVVVVPALLLLAVFGLGLGRRAALATIPYFVVAAGLAAVHMVVASTEGTAGVSLGAADTTGNRLAASGAAMGRYLVTLVGPFSLSVEHGIGPGTEDLLHVMGFGGLFVLLVLATLAAIRRGGTARTLGLALAAVLVALAPFNGVFPRTSVLYAERYLYVAAALACGGMAWVAARPVPGNWLQRNGRWLYLAGIGGFAFHHLPVWKDSLALWEHAVADAPQATLAHAKLGEALNDAALSSRDAKERTPLFERAAAEHRLAAEHARTPLEEMRARHDAGVALLGAGKYGESAAELARGMALTGAAGDALTPAFRASLGVNRAKALEASGKTAEAMAVLEEVVRGDPLAAAAWTNLGVMRMAAGNLDGARTALLTATKADGTLIAARLSLADLEEVGGDFAAALRIVVKAVEVSPQDTAALCKAGEICFLLGQPLKSEEWYRKAIAVDGADPVARRGLAGALAYRARTLLGEGKGPAARAVADEATATDPGSAEAWFALGDVLRATGDGTGALEAYRRAGKEGGGQRAADARASVYLAQAFALRGKKDGDAVTMMEKALDEHPTEIRLPGRHAPVKEGLERIPPPPGGEGRHELMDGLLSLAAGETVAALASLDNVLKDDGFNDISLRPAALVFRSRARISADDIPGAVADLETLVHEAPKDARARYLLGVTLGALAARQASTGRKAEADATSERARAALEEARALDPDLAEAPLALAEMYFGQDRAVDAIREVNGVLDRHPDLPQANLVLGNIMKAKFVETRDRSCRDQGEEHFRKVLAADPGEARALVGLGEIAAFSNKPKEALSYALRAMAADPDLPGARALAATLFLRSGRSHLEEGDVAGALEAAKRADELSGETPALCLLRADAYRRKGDWKAAGAEVERARTLSPDDPEVRDGVATHYRDVCYAFLLHGRRDQAEEALRRAEAAGSARVDLGEVRRLFEKKTGATAPALDPAVADALDRVFADARRLSDEGAALFRDGKPAEAAEKFRESIRNYESPVGRFGLGLSLKAAGDAAGAEKEYRRAAELEPEYADAWLNLGALLLKRGATAEAEAAYGNYLKFAPKEGAEETVVRVEALLEDLKAKREKK